MSHFCWWNWEILKPIQNEGTQGKGKLAFEKLGKLLDRIMLRRTKVQKADDLVSFSFMLSFVYFYC